MSAREWPEMSALSLFREFKVKSLLPLLFVANLGAGIARAQESYPARYIRVISPFGAGSLTDLTLRPLADRLSQKLGWRVVVESRPGASGLIAGRACASAAPDGYTICMLHGDAVSYAPFLYRSVGYDPANDLAPITNNYFAAAVLAVNPSLGVNNVQELVALSKARPEGLGYANLSTTIKFFMDQFGQEAGANLYAVPYKGGAEATMAVVGGSVDMMFAGLANIISQVESGQLKVIAVEGDARLPSLPDVPTFKEAGIMVDRLRTWFGIFAPAGTEPAIVQKLHAGITAAYQDIEFRNLTLVKLGLDPVLNSPGEFSEFLKLESARAKAQFERAGYEPQ